MFEVQDVETTIGGDNPPTNSSGTGDTGDISGGNGGKSVGCGETDLLAIRHSCTVLSIGPQIIGGSGLKTDKGFPPVES